MIHSSRGSDSHCAMNEKGTLGIFLMIHDEMSEIIGGGCVCH